MSDIQETEMLAREAQLVFSNAEGWSMSEGSLRTWRGTIENVSFEIFLPRMFPEVPPVVRALRKVSHPNIDADGRVSLRILENWRVEYHIYQIILQLTSLLKRNPGNRQVPQTNTQNYTPPSSQQTQNRPIFPISNRRSPLPTATKPSDSSQAISSEVAVMRKELDRLKEEVTKRDEELTHIRAKEAIGATGTGNYQGAKIDDQVANLEAEQIAISELMVNLDEKHETGEISSIEFSKLFKKYSRDLFILSKKIEFVQAKQ
jgi:hypothetical protein